jgi:PhnB protein
VCPHAAAARQAGSPATVCAPAYGVAGSNWLPTTSTGFAVAWFHGPVSRSESADGQSAPRAAATQVSDTAAMPTSMQPELWVDRAAAAVAFYEAAFGATVLHRVGEGDAIVAQLAVGDAAFWVAAANPNMQRLSPRAINGATSRTLMVVDDPDQVLEQAVHAGARETSPVDEEHGWRLGRIIDPFGHEWEVGAPLGAWPPR